MTTSYTRESPTTDESRTEQAKHVASVATGEAKSLAGDVREQARGLLDETRNQVQDQSRSQRDRIVETLRTFSDDLEGMAEQRGGLASDAAREVANRARSIGQQLDGREPAELLDDVRSFARRRPGLFLAGSVVAGVVVGRILRGTRDAAQGTAATDAMTTQERPAMPPVPAYEPGYDPGFDPATPPTPVSEPVETGRPVGGP